MQQLSSITTLTEEEIGLVRRLETSLLWAGRYPVPWTLQTYVDDSLQLRELVKSSDLDTAEGLYKRLRSLVQSEPTAEAALEQVKGEF